MSDSALVPADRRRFTGVLMQRRVLSSVWQPYVWVPAGVQRAEGLAARRLIRSEADFEEWLYPELPVELFRDEAEGYYLNISAPAPAVFVHWSEEGGAAAVHRLTVSYNEAARLMDGGMQVDPVAMPPEWVDWVGSFSRAHYRPGTGRKRSRPPSFDGARRSARS